MNIGAYILLFGSVLIGAWIGLYVQRDRSKHIMSFVLPFSGAFLLGVAVLHMLPEVFSHQEASILVGGFILLGFLIQIILEFFSRGIEHGHVHLHPHKGLPYVLSIMFGLCVHAFLEGMPINFDASFHEGHTHSAFMESYLWSIAIHKLPAAVALSILLFHSGLDRWKVFFFIVIFAFMSPLGSLTAQLGPAMGTYHHLILALAIGSILHVATIIIYETDENSNHKISYKKLLAVLLGFMVSILTLL